MLLLERSARSLLLVHAVSAGVLVGATTHHLLWCRGYLKRQFGRAKSERRFALIATSAFVFTFVLGNLLYPTYKVRVRAEYLDSGAAVAEDARLRAAADRAVGAPRVESTAAPGLSAVSHVFDIKEHWVALGCAASLVLLALSRLAHPKDHPRVLPLYLGLAAFVCASAWCGALVGLWTASFRSVGGVT